MPVTFVTVEPRPHAIEFQRVGVAEASRVAEVRARVTGFLSERLFTEGEPVEVGQVLYRIERDLFEAQVEAFEADLLDAEARLVLAESNYERTLSLRQTEAISQERLDETSAEVARAKAAVARARADIREARIDLGFTEVVAPVSGIAGRAVRDVGDLVDTASEGLMTTITAISPIYVTFGISEQDYLRLGGASAWRSDNPVEFRAILTSGEMHDEVGRLNFVAPDFDPATGMLPIRIEFPNSSGALRPNQFLKIVENRGTDTMLAVPKRAVLQSPAGPAVFTINAQDQAEFRPVQVGRWIGDDWEVVSGLEPGERVMVDGFMKAPPGSTVAPTPYRAAPADAAATPTPATAQ